MGADKRDLLAVLKAELAFLEKGGYRDESWRPNFIFEDSPSCLNCRDLSRAKPCSECAFMQLVPPERRNEKIPCRFIPLDAIGTTVDFLYRTATQDELEAELRNWLKNTIDALQAGQRVAEQAEPAPKAARVGATA